MNFCGVRLEDQVVHSAKRLPDAKHTLCCINDRTKDVLSMDEDDESLNVSKNALDVIQQTLSNKSPEPEDEEEEEEIKGATDPSTTVATARPPSTATSASISPRLEPPHDKTPSPLTLTPEHYSGTMSSSHPQYSIASPSPILLNPLSVTPPRSNSTFASGNTSSRLLSCPDLTGTSTLQGLVQRLQQGFHVRLQEDGVPVRVFLYLHPENDRLCIVHCDEDDEDDDEKKIMDDWVTNSVQVPMHKILRMEVGGGKNSNAAAMATSPHHNSMNCFSIVVNQDADIEYYDFEANSPVEREVLVSTLIVVLDQAHHRLEMRKDNTTTGLCVEQQQDTAEYFNFGTMDQPIPCSPSLEQLENSQQQQYQLQPTLSPQNRTHIYGDQTGSTETSLAGVIHLEDMVISPASSSVAAAIAATMPTVDESQPLSTMTTNLTQKSSHEEVGGFLFDHCHGGSSGQMAPWCTDDVCTNALRDIAETAKDVFALKQEQACVDPEEQRAMIEEYIATALGSSTAMYSYLTKGGDVWTGGDVWNARKDSTASSSKGREPNRIQNRASLLNAQARRLRNLRNEMTFAAALKQSKERMHYVQTTQSFDASKLSKGNSSPKMRAATQAANRFHTSALLETVVGNMLMHDSNGREQEEKEKVVYYDSDPEDVRPRTMTKGPRRVKADRLNKLMANNERNSQNPHPTALSGTDFVESIGTTKKVSKKLDEDIIVEIVQTMNNERLTLMWHPTQTTERPNKSPLCVKLWIEHGVYLMDGSFLLPKLSWAKAMMSNSESKKLPPEPMCLDLLDVCRIRPPTKIDRRCHPFANVSKSFCIETQSDLYLFETRTTEERDRIVYGLKLVIARLASLLMLRDMRAAEEFFGAIAAGVPGEAPGIFIGKGSE